MRTKIILIVVLILSQASFSQKKIRADRFFEKGDYINAAIAYEEELNNVGYDKRLLGNISTCYYNTFKFRQAYRYLAILTKGKFYEKDKTYDNSYNFMMHQVLASLGKYQKSVDYLKLYKRNLGEIGFVGTDAISTIEAFKLKENDYMMAPVRFNSKASEFGAVKRGDTVYFTTDRGSSTIMGKHYNWTHRPFLDINTVKVDEKNFPVEQVESISSAINTSLHEGNFCFSSDGNTIYYSKSNSEKGRKKYDSLGNNPIHLYKSTKIAGVWSESKKLPFNNIDYSLEHPALSSDDTQLYFASNMPGGYGGFDIYKVAVNGDDTYGEVVNLGRTINTVNREQFPFVDVKGNLFFSSNGHLGLGMMDIFVSENKEGVLAMPVNLGAPINSGYDDFSMTYYNEHDGFFASNRKNKTDDDIYSFIQNGEIFLKPHLARFEVRDFASDNYIKNANVVLYDMGQKEVHKQQLDSIGAFNIEVMPGKYDFKASAENYDSKIKPIMVKDRVDGVYLIYLDRKRDTVPSNSELSSVDVPIEGRKSKNEKLKAEEIRRSLIEDTEGPAVIEKDGKLYFDVPPIHFDYDKWTIRSDSKKVLDEFALKLEKYKSVYIKIHSHTDSRGTDSYNQILSEKRAEATRNYLALVGYVNARRMDFEGYGESEPLIDCVTKECTELEYETNRRSDFEIIKF